MAGSISSISVEKFRGKLSSPSVQELFLVWGFESDLERLDIFLLFINMAVVSAEEQRDTKRKTSWLRQLRDVLYDAEDLLDDFAYQTLRKQIVDSHGGISGKVHRYLSIYNPITFRFKIGRQIREIRERLREVLTDKSPFNFGVQFGNPSLQPKEMELSHSYVDASKIMGRERDRETVVEFLLDSRDRNNNVSVFAVVGISGLGKTALAKIAFNDERVACHFDKRVWVCLSDMKEFNVKQILKKIVMSVSKIPIFDDSTLEQLQIFILNSLHSKRLLLILDDVWNVDRSKWLELKALLASCNQGSKIVVTTRITSVASCMGTVAAHNLEGICHEDCVSLFKKIAFSCEDEVDKNLMEIGEEIVRKCKGVPSAVRTLGSILFSKPDVRDWLLVRDGGIWQMKESHNEILPMLKFSYDELPSHLKQCFVCCSVFPEEYLFQDFWLISFWMAHGLLQSRKNEDPIHIGRQYIDELLSRGLFQNFKEHSWYCSFKMHGLVRDLAISLGQEEFSTSKNLSKNVRHVCSEVQNFSANSSDNVIRTILAPHEGFEATFSATCISKFKRLRVLSLANSKIEELSQSIGTLKHLRSLDLRGCTRLKRLSNSICKLHCLETLLLAGCAEVKELPMRLKELVNLRWLWITTKQKHLLKNGIECISSLNFLALSGCRNLELFFEGNKVTHLKSLQTLRISDCESLVSLFPLNLGALEVLYIRSCEKLNFHHQEDDVSSQWFVQLPSLRSLTIQGLPLVEGLPHWIQRCTRTLQYLKIKDCSNLAALPEWLPNLTSLVTLKILRCPKLLSLPDGMQNLNAMIEVKIFECGVLSQRCKNESGVDWPKIAHVDIV